MDNFMWGILCVLMLLMCVIILLCIFSIGFYIEEKLSTRRVSTMSNEELISVADKLGVYHKDLFIKEKKNATN